MTICLILHLSFRCTRYRPWCEIVTLSDNKEYVFLGGGDPGICVDGIDGIEEYDVAEDEWNIASRHNTIQASGPSIKVSVSINVHCK